MVQVLSAKAGLSEVLVEHPWRELALDNDDSVLRHQGDIRLKHWKKLKNL